ncbi:MAG: polysaccharide deacetylase family protein [Betaproteobacteria bacterium]|nr:polysaccharide deacetylase family protein [Betaproteobacteria bacterium]
MMPSSSRADDVVEKISGEGYHYHLIKNFKYPKGIRIAVNFTFDFDSMLKLRLSNEPIMELTEGEFGGRVGIWNALDLFDRQNIKFTLFTPGRICELYPDAVREAQKRGHEIANHTWEHRVPKEPELERDHLRKATDALEKLCGKKPVGTRSNHKISSLNAEGYLYDSQRFKDSDEIPYYVLQDGGQSCILNLPFHLVTDDAMYFRFGWQGATNAGNRLADPEHVYQILTSAFRQYYKMGKYFNVCCHPYISGRSMRIAVLERLIVDMKKMPGVWFCTCEELARYCLENFPAPTK